MVWQIGLLLGFGLVLAASAQIVVQAASVLARRFGLTSFAIGFLLLGVLTSTPEFFVAIQSAAAGVPQLSMGNLLGGSILLLSLVMGITSTLLGRISLDHRLSFREIILASSVVASPILVLWDGNLTRPEGIFLIGLYLLHGFLLNHKGRNGKKKMSYQRFHGVWHEVGTLILGFGAMLVASKVIVESAQVITASLRMPPFVFGLVLLSIGTNLPEFALAIEAAVQRRKTIAFGDFLGSSAANTFILGLLGWFTPFEVATSERLWFSLVLLGSVTAFFLWALSSRRDITRKEGVGLIFFYVAFVVFELGGW